ncbi:hypothetical protein T4C_7456 [Trichinella pseudospiralis]|uniref:Uncharacterized protein n=1 Tax=Trichinella pseudospiralis TaxID=6337 RepID=A0A0V1JS17_TRIPS|nr:hypothetical protein T4C_7456 [Trichinella pseudospiralis]
MFPVFFLNSSLSTSSALDWWKCKWKIVRQTPKRIRPPLLIGHSCGGAEVIRNRLLCENALAMRNASA